MPSNCFGRTAIILAGLGLAILLASDVGRAGGKGSNGVVKATATASKPDASGRQAVTVTLAVDKGWHVYANPVDNKDYKEVQTVVTFPRLKATDVQVQYPKGKTHQEKDGTSYVVYEDKIIIQAVVQRAVGDTSPLELEVRFNACHGMRGICLAPGSEKIVLPN